MNPHVLEDLSHEMWLDEPNSETAMHKFLLTAYRRGLNGDGLTPAELREFAIRHLNKATELEAQLAQKTEDEHTHTYPAGSKAVHDGPKAFCSLPECKDPKPVVKGLLRLTDSHAQSREAEDYEKGDRVVGFSGRTYEVDINEAGHKVFVAKGWKK